MLRHGVVRRSLELLIVKCLVEGFQSNQFHLWTPPFSVLVYVDKDDAQWSRKENKIKATSILCLIYLSNRNRNIDRVHFEVLEKLFLSTSKSQRGVILDPKASLVPREISEIQIVFSKKNTVWPSNVVLAKIVRRPPHCSNKGPRVVYQRFVPETPVL